MRAALADDATLLEHVLFTAHSNMDRDDRRYPRRNELPLHSRLSWEHWRQLDGRRSCIDGRPL